MIAPIMEELRCCPEGVWGEYALRRDVMYQKLKHNARFYTEGANRCGRDVARRATARCCRLHVQELTDELGVEIENMVCAAAPGYRLLAEFEPPRTVRIARRTLDQTTAIMRSESIFFMHQPLEDHLVAHELFHVLESQDDELFTRSARIQTGGPGPLSGRSEIRSIKEIAAMRFARTILHLDHSPFVLDILVLYSTEPRAALRLADEMRAIWAAREELTA